jgi:precorrin-6A/cobalt-precorrin-6A reductase
MILILGGTAEARELAAVLVERHIDVLSSLAGRVSQPALPAGQVRIGGFGGVDGLAAFIVEQRVGVVVDATHPFAARISGHAIAATQATGVPLIRLVRPSWRDHRDAAAWTWTRSSAAAMGAAPGATRPLLTTGRQSLAEFLPWADRAVVARVVDPPGFEVPVAWTIIRSRGPYDLGSERALMLRYGVDLLVTKDSGGTLTNAKLDAARELGVAVVVIDRPTSGSGLSTVDEVLVALDRTAARSLDP